jgi:hypothetical protein
VVETSTEISRIESGMDEMPDICWVFRLQLASDHDLTNVREVVRTIAEADPDQWPDDAYWNKQLPDWVLSSMPTLSREACEELLRNTPRAQWNSLPWEFASWLEAIRFRGWRWWGSESLPGGQARIAVRVVDLPERIDAFAQLVRSTGSTILSSDLCQRD